MTLIYYSPFKFFVYVHFQIIKVIFGKRTYYIHIRYSYVNIIKLHPRTEIHTHIDIYAYVLASIEII